MLCHGVAVATYYIAVGEGASFDRRGSSRSSYNLSPPPSQLASLLSVIVRALS